MNSPGDETAVKMRDVGLTNIGPAVDFMDRHEFELPASVRTRIPELRSAIEIRDIGRRNIDAVMLQMDSVQEIVSRPRSPNCSLTE